MDAIKYFVGLRIQKIEKVHDYLQMIFSNDMILNIYNNYKYNSNSILSLKNKEIKFAIESNEEIVFGFQDNNKLIISLKDADYNGPEAMELSCEGKTTIVWN